VLGRHPCTLPGQPSRPLSTASPPQEAAEALKQNVKALLALSAQSPHALQDAQIQVALLHAAVAIGGALQTVHGGGADAAEVKAEHTRAKAYHTKVQKAVAREELKGLRKHTEINIDAAHRFITHAIPELTREQRNGLTQVSVKRQGTSRLNDAPLLAAERKAINSTVHAERGQTAVERLQSRRALVKGWHAPAQDAADALLDDLASS